MNWVTQKLKGKGMVFLEAEGQGYRGVEGADLPMLAHVFCSEMSQPVSPGPRVPLWLPSLFALPWTQGMASQFPHPMCEVVVGGVPPPTGLL